MPERRLAAILAADIVGYSALMAEDEAGTLEALRRLRREVFHPTVAGHRGKVVKALGDGWLVEFGSAIDSVNCALQIQQRLAGEVKIRVRIGIHLGDITHEDEDIYGDGVNVAARLEALSEPGAVTISDAVHGALDGTLTRSFDDAGERTLKNIARPVRVWVRGAMPEIAATRPAATEDPRAGFPVVVAIVPIATSDPRGEVRELAAALTNDLFNYLDNGRWLSARVTETPPGDVFALSATLRASGDRLRLDATVADPAGGIVWSRRIDGSLADSFDWQDAAGYEIATGVTSAIHDAERARLATLSDDETTAGNWMVRALMLPYAQIDTALERLDAIERAIERDPGWALPYATGCTSIRQSRFQTGSPTLDAYASRFEEWYRRACANPEADAETERALAYLAFLENRALDGLMLKIEGILRRFPYHVPALSTGVSACVYAGEAQRCVDFCTKLLTVCADPVEAAVAKIALGCAYIQLGREQKAVRPLRESLEVQPRSIPAIRILMSAYGHLGMRDEAAQLLARYIELASDMKTVADVRRITPFVDTPGTRRYFDGLRMAGMPEGDE